MGSNGKSLGEMSGVHFGDECCLLRHSLETGRSRSDTLLPFSAAGSIYPVVHSFDVVRCDFNVLRTNPGWIQAGEPTDAHHEFYWKPNDDDPCGALYQLGLGTERIFISSGAWSEPGGRSVAGRGVEVHAG